MRTLKGMCGLGLAASLGFVGQAQAQASRDGGYVIRDVSVVDVEVGVVRSNQDVYVVDGRIHLTIQAAYSLEQVVEAFDVIRDRRIRGKVILLTDGGV